MWRRSLLLYLCVVHSILALAAWQYFRCRHAAEGEPSAELGPYFRTMLGHQSRLDAALAPGFVLFFGDSITQSLNASALTPRAVNFGIGGDTTRGLLARLPFYRSLVAAQAIVLEIGVNDLKYRSAEETLENHREILRYIPLRVPVVLSAVLPVDETALAAQGGRTPTNASIRILNRGLEDLCRQRGNCIFADVAPELIDATGNLRKDAHVGDGVHLNAAGYGIWGRDIGLGLSRLPTQRDEKRGRHPPP